MPSSFPALMVQKRSEKTAEPGFSRACDALRISSAVFARCVHGGAGSTGHKAYRPIGCPWHPGGGSGGDRRKQFGTPAAHPHLATPLRGAEAIQAVCLIGMMAYGSWRVWNLVTARQAHAVR